VLVLLVHRCVSEDDDRRESSSDSANKQLVVDVSSSASQFTSSANSHISVFIRDLMSSALCIDNLKEHFKIEFSKLKQITRSSFIPSFGERIKCNQMFLKYGIYYTYITQMCTIVRVSYTSDTMSKCIQDSNNSVHS